MIYFIQGVFFQSLPELVPALAPHHGHVLVMGSRFHHVMYAGFIQTKQGQTLTGMIEDQFGRAVLSNISIGEQISFTKRYEGKNHSIDYVFRVKNGRWWAGEYTGDKVGSGTSSCLITSIDEDILNPKKVWDLVKQKLTVSC